jgi:phosphoglycolate phosphatase-like HAD superfamily hydrolase
MVVTARSYAVTNCSVKTHHTLMHTHTHIYTHTQNINIYTEAWKLAPGATKALTKMHNAGVLLAVVSNFDTRLRQVCACAAV